jgi:hypothetical protein
VARAILILLIVCLTQGCFVFDELDKGEAIMNAHRAKPAAEAAKPAPISRAAEPEPGLLADLGETVQGWWTAATEEAAPQRDPADIPVRCEIDGRMLYTRKSDCHLRGGKIL